MCGLTIFVRKLRSKWYTEHENSLIESETQTPSSSSFGFSVGSNNEEDFVHPAERNGVAKLRLSINIPVLLAFFAIAVAGTPFTNQLLYQTCIYEFNYSRTECEPLLGKVPKTNQTSEIENEVQPYVAYILTVNTMITNILPALFCLAAGPWSDKYGRRPMLIFAVAGYSMSYIILSALSGVSVNYNLNPWIFLVSSVPVGFTGGSCLLITMVFAYISDVYAGKYRAFSMIVAQTLIGAGEGIGNIAGGIIYSKSNLLTTFITSAVAITISLVYLVFVNVESLHVIEEGSRIKAFFSMDVVRKFWETSTKKRKPFHRTFIWCIIFSVVILNFISDGQLNISYLFLSKKFNWDLSTYNVYMAVTAIVSVVVCILSAYILIKLLKISVIALIFIVMIGNVLESLSQALAAYSWEIYGAKILGCLGGIAVPTLRSILSMLVTEIEVGTIFSINNSLQYLVAIGAAPLYSAVYATTLSFDAALYNYLSVLLYVICMILIGVIYYLKDHLRAAVIPTS